MFQNSFNTSTEASFLSNKSTTIDRDILEKLMLYIENTLDSKLNSIEKLIDKNKSNLSKAKKKFLLAERKLMNYKRESSGSSLISDDIKFFFNLVKSKPKDKVIKGVFVKDGRPSPRFGGYSRPPVAGKSRSRSIRGISQPKRRRKDKAHLRDNDSSSLETRVIFEKSSSKVKPGKSQRNVKRRWKKDNVRKQAKKKISSVSRAKSRPKSPMKRWEQLYNMANEKSKQRVNENEDVENNRKLANTPIRLSDRVFGNGENKAFESTQKKERKYPAILDNQQSPSKKLKNQRNLLRSRRLLDSEEMERKKQRDNMCLQNISKIEKEYQSNIGYCESSDSSFEENPKTKKLTPLINPMSRRSSEFLLDSKQANNYNLKMPSTDSDQQQTMDYLELMKSRKSKKKPFEPFYPHNGTNESTSDISNLENYLTDRPNHKSPIRQKRDEHPLVALGEVEKANESDDEGEQGRTNTERLMHQSIRNLDEESFSRDQTGKRLIDGMLDMDCDNSQILNACASEGNNTWKEIEEERMQVVQMLEGMMRSGTEDVDYSSTENIFKQYETFRSNKNNQNKWGNKLNSNLDKVSEKTAEYSQTQTLNTDSVPNSRYSIASKSRSSPESDLESELGIVKIKPLSKNSSSSNFVSFKDSNFGVKNLHMQALSEQERVNFSHISISEKSDICRTEGFENMNEEFNTESTFDFRKSNLPFQKKLAKDPSLVFKSKQERVIIFEESSRMSETNKENHSPFESLRDSFQKIDKVEILTKKIVQNCKTGNINIKEVRKSVKIILSMPQEVQEQLLKTSFPSN